MTRSECEDGGAMFRVGMKVVCVDAEPLPKCCWSGGAPKTGAIYTITSVHAGPDSTSTLWLAEIARSPKARREWGPSVGYGAWRFRPIVEKKTDISIFVAMLTPKKATEREPASRQKAICTDED